MNASNQENSQPAVAVFGASGHTGRFVLAELLRRGIAPIAITRTSGSLPPDPQVLYRHASVHDTPSLDRALGGAAAVINCAGPFLETADAVASAALRSRIHYLDVTAEQQSARTTLDTYDLAARQVGIAIVPSMSFYGGFADLLTTAALADWDHADTIDVMIGLDSWHPTRGTRITGEKNTAQRMVIAAGQLAPVSLPRSEKSWDFGNPLGLQSMVETPFSEIVLIAQHLKTAELHTWLNRLALDDIHSPTTPAPVAADDTGRSPQRFIVEVVATRDNLERRIVAHGRDIYAFSATLVCEAVERLLQGKFTRAGAQPPAVLFNPKEILTALAPDHLSIEIT